MVKKLLVILGNGNDEEGNLSETAVLRARTAIAFLNHNSDYYVIPTGHFGDHFNNFHIPHGILLRNYLIQYGVSPQRILPHTLSSNTLEDAWSILKYIHRSPSVEHIHIITSRFHMARVKFIFGRILHRYSLSYEEAPDPQMGNMDHLVKHERKAIAKLKKEWVDISNFPPDTPSEQSCENLGQELRHYDKFSYSAIAGSFILLGFTLSNRFPENSVAPHVFYLASILLVLLFWYLYLRLASTAASARRVLVAVERFYGIPGISATKQKIKFIRIKSTISLIFLLIALLILLKWLLLIN